MAGQNSVNIDMNNCILRTDTFTYFVFFRRIYYSVPFHKVKNSIR